MKAVSLLLGIVVLVVGACSGSTEPAYFALAPRPAPPQAGAPQLVEIRRPSIAGYLDRADIVTRVRDYQLQIETGERWAEPLGDMIGRVLAQNLSSRLGESQVFVEGGAIATTPVAVVAVDIQTFVAESDGQVTLVAQVLTETPGAPNVPRARSFTLRTRPTGTGTAALVATMSGLLGELSGGIATMLREH